MVRRLSCRQRSGRQRLLLGCVLLAGTVGLASAGVLHAQVVSRPERVKIPDEELDRLRGGFVLPNGMDIAIGIDIETLVNGALALRTTVSSEGGPVVYAGGGDALAELVPNGAALSTAAGPVRLEEGENGSAVILQGAAFEIRHLVGRFTGTAVANTADNMTIDTVTTINVDLRGSTVPVDNAVLHWDAIATDVARQSIR